MPRMSVLLVLSGAMWIGCGGDPVSDPDAGPDGGPHQEADAGPDGGPVAPACFRSSCAAAGANCGEITLCDGGVEQCGTCDGSQACGAGGVANVCGVADTRVGYCSEGWCWINPWPQGNSLDTVHGASADDVWAVGDRGTALHWDGGTWAPRATGTGAELRDVFTEAGGGAWAIGVDPGPIYRTVILRWDGGAWDTMVRADGGFSGYSIFARGPDEVVAGGYYYPRAGYMTFDGGEWSLPVQSAAYASIESMWGPSDGGTLWLGSTGNPHSSAPDGVFEWSTSYWNGDLRDISVRDLEGSAENDVWAATTDGPWHYDGGTWARPAPLPAAARWDAIASVSASEAWAFGERGSLPTSLLRFEWDGAAWTEHPSPLPYTPASTWGAATDDGWAVGPAGLLARRDANGWSEYSRGSGALGAQALVVTSPDDAWVFESGGKIRRYTAQGISTVSTGAPRLTAAWAFGANDVWASDEPSGSGIYHWDGQAWRKVESALYGVSAIHGRSANDVLFAGALSVRRWNGTSFSFTLVGGERWHDVHVLPSGARWMVGEDGNIARSTGPGASWTISAGPANGNALRKVWGFADDDVWVASSSQLFHWNGTTWTPFDPPTAAGGIADIQTLFGTASNDLWAGGSDFYGGVLWHYDGIQWSLVEIGLNPTVTDLRGSGGTVWAAGSSGMVLRRQ